INIPEPIIDPATIMVESNSPRLRTSLRLSRDSTFEIFSTATLPGSFPIGPSLLQGTVKKSNSNASRLHTDTREEVDSQLFFTSVKDDAGKRRGGVRSLDGLVTIRF